MRAVLDWLQRLRSSKAEEIQWRYARAITPGHTDLRFIEGPIAASPQTHLPGGPGHLPQSASVLQLVDQVGALAVNEDHALQSQIGALLTFATGRIVQVLYEITSSVQGVPQVMFHPVSSAFDMSLDGPIEADGIARIRPLLAQLDGLSPKDAAVIGAAVELHYSAAILRDRDVWGAYLLLVAGIEALADRFGARVTNWNDWSEHPDWDRLFDKAGLSGEQRRPLQRHLLRRPFALTERFARYGSTRIRDEFWSMERHQWTYPVSAPQGVWLPPHKLDTQLVRDFLPEDRDIVRAALRSSYSARSRFVHDGVRMSSLQLLSFPGTVPGQETPPIPFAILRLILVELITVELESRSTPTTLPDVHISQPPIR